MAMQELLLSAQSLEFFAGSNPSLKILRYSGRNLLVIPENPFLGSALCHRVQPSGRNCFALAAASPFWGLKQILEKRWQELFSDPSQWYDYRQVKLNARYPDFKHKKTQEGLWLDNELKPLWVEAELAAMAPGTLQIGNSPWNTRLQKSLRARQYKKTIELFHQMQAEDVNPNNLSFTTVLNACASLRALSDGRHIHKQIKPSDIESDVYLANSIIDMYAKCGSIENAVAVFKQMLTHNVVSWNAMILGYARCGQGRKALELFQQMRQEGLEPDNVTFLGLLKACSSVPALEEGRVVHAQIINFGCESDIFVGSSLVDMYAKCGSIEDAWRVFNNMPTRDVVSWNAMILGHVKSGQGQQALELYREMQREGMEPDTFTFVGVLNACGSLKAFEEGRAVHRKAIERGFESNIFVGNSLIDMYTSCGSLDSAWKVFNKMPRRDLVSWNVMILGHVKCGLGKNALQLFQQMEQEHVEPDRVTFLALLSACASLEALQEGKDIHRKIMKRGWNSDVFVGSSLIDMYSKSGSIHDAWEVFIHMPQRNVVSWNSMIMGFVKCGKGRKALQLSRDMQWEGIEPDSLTLSGVLNACACVADDSRGIEDAWRVFNKIPIRDVNSWNAMILGHLKCGKGQDALELSRQMQREGVEPDRVTFVGVLSACASVEALEEGRDVHTQIIEHGCESDVFVGSSLVDMYAKCGSIGDAWRVFKKMPTHNMVSWNAMIEGHSKSGRGQKELELCYQMERRMSGPTLFPHVGVLNKFSRQKRSPEK